MVVYTYAYTFVCGCRLNTWCDNGLTEQEWQRKQELLDMGDLRILDEKGAEVKGLAAVELLVEKGGLSRDEAAFRVGLRAEQLAVDEKENRGPSPQKYITPDEAKKTLRIPPPYNPSTVVDGVPQMTELRCFNHRTLDGAALFEKLRGH